MHRFFVSNLDEIGMERARVCSVDLLQQWNRVLKFRVGERVVLLDNSGYEWEVEIEKLGPKEIVGRVVEKRFCEGELPVRVVVAQALLKNMERFEWALQKGTELGVAAFVPLITDRTERKALGKVERMQRILKEAAEQSGMGKISELFGTCRFGEIFENFGDAGRIFVVLEPGVEEKFSDFLKTRIDPCSITKALVMDKFRKDDSKENSSGVKEIFVCVGPEGGFTESEIELAKVKGAHLLSLGPRVLRAETVVAVVGSLINQALGVF